MTTTETPRVPNEELPAFLRYVVAQHDGLTHGEDCEGMPCGALDEFTRELADTLERDPHHVLAMKAVRAMLADDLTDEDTARVYAGFTQAGRPGFTPRPQVAA